MTGEELMDEVQSLSNCVLWGSDRWYSSQGYSLPYLSQPKRVDFSYCVH